MSDAFRCFVRGEPRAKGSKKAFVQKGRPIIVDSNPNTRSWQRLIQDRVSAEFKGEPWAGPLEVSLVFGFVRPASAKKRRMPSVRPDLDKLARAVLDALEAARVMLDDAQVVSMSVLKEYLEIPGVQIEVRKLEPAS